MTNGGPPNSHFECKQQLLFDCDDCIEEEKDCRRGICQAYSMILRFSTGIDVASHPLS